MPKLEMSVSDVEALVFRGSDYDSLIDGVG